MFYLGFLKKYKACNIEAKSENFFSEDGIRSDSARRPLTAPAPGPRRPRAGAGCLLRSFPRGAPAPAPARAGRELDASCPPASMSPPRAQLDGAWRWPWVWRGPIVVRQYVAEKRKDPVQSSLNSGRQAPATSWLLCLRPAGRGHRLLSRAKAVQRPPPWDSAPRRGWASSHAPSELERRGSRRTKPCSSAFGSFFLNAGLSFSTEFNYWTCRPDSQTGQPVSPETG